MVPAMTVLRMDNISIVVDDLQAAIDFFVELGLSVEGKATVAGESVDRLIDLDDVRTDVVMMKTPDGHGRLELTKFHNPPAIAGPPSTANTLGISRIMFAVEDIEAVVARLQARGAKLFREIVQYENSYRLCYMRGPEGIIIALAEALD